MALLTPCQRWCVVLAAVLSSSCVVVPEATIQSADVTDTLDPPLQTEPAPVLSGPFDLIVPVQNNSAPAVPLESAVAELSQTASLSDEIADLPAKLVVNDAISDSPADFNAPNPNNPEFDIPHQAGRENGFTAIAYHRIGNDNSPYTVTPQDFTAQIQYLSDGGFNSITLAQLVSFYEQGVALPERAVLITVDDGHRTSFSEIHPVLTTYGFSAVYFPYSDFIDNGGLSTNMIRQMIREGGAEVGIHTKTHAALTLQRDFETDRDYQNRVLDEIAQPVALLGAISGVQQIAIAYPYGKVNRQVEQLARTVGLDFGFTVNCALNTRSTNRLRLNRCTVGRDDGVELFAAKIVNPRIAMNRIARGQSARGEPITAAAVSRLAPEYLGSLANREYFTGVEIEPFSAYFVHPRGERMKYRANGLPAGLQIDASSGVVSGTPIKSARGLSVNIVAIDESGARTPSDSFDITVY